MQPQQHPMVTAGKIGFTTDCQNKTNWHIQHIFGTIFKCRRNLKRMQSTGTQTQLARLTKTKSCFAKRNIVRARSLSRARSKSRRVDRACAGGTSGYAVPPKQARIRTREENSGRHCHCLIGASRVSWTPVARAHVGESRLLDLTERGGQAKLMADRSPETQR